MPAFASAAPNAPATITQRELKMSANVPIADAIAPVTKPSWTAIVSHAA
jgi:hypothetical protein